MPASLPNPLRLQFVRHKDAPRPPTRSPAWRVIDVVVTATVLWSIGDGGTTCAAASADEANYACASNHSFCDLNTDKIDLGYKCRCGHGYTGNPYLLHGCTRDYGYSPVQQVGCSEWCGSIYVPFPFGIKEGCCGRKEFELSCDDMSKLTISAMYGSRDAGHVTHINVDEGFIEMDHSYGSFGGAGSPYIHYQESGNMTLYWAVANLTCQEAQQNMSAYACVSINSTCIDLISGHGGYRCKCMPGFTGNSYLQSGCQDIDECKTPGICKGICHNNIGSHHCTKCPDKTEYDTIAMKCRPTAARRQNILLGIGIGLSVGFGLLLLGLSAAFLIRRWRRDIQKQQRRKYFRKNQGLLLQQLISSDECATENTKIFSLEELGKATNNFDQTRILGRGGHGMVYKGILSDQRVVAIKKSMVIEQCEIDQFINEVAILSQINHRNIVKLYGCCLETEVPLLVYDFVSNGSLSETLHSDPGRSSTASPLFWDDCLRIAAEVAGALSYLHSAASISVFHRDVKSSNVLLDANYTAKVSDFGASRLVPTDQSHVSTIVQGTFGYLDPEYYHTGQLNQKSDVYSFGVLLLELLLRRKPIFTGESGLPQSLANYFLCQLKERPIKEIIAAQVRQEATKEEIDNVASLAETCLRLRGEERPTMKEAEMSLQLLRTKRFKATSLVTPAENGRDMETSMRRRANTAARSRPVGNAIDPVSANSQRCYSLEQEFMSSASIPR